jgi:hypothetical protein
MLDKQLRNRPEEVGPRLETSAVSGVRAESPPYCPTRPDLDGGGHHGKAPLLEMLSEGTDAWTPSGRS